MANKTMKTLTIGENTYEVVDEQARADIEGLKQNPVIETDATLTQSGQAADAKVVGDTIKNIETQIDGKQPKGNYLTEHQDISGKLDADKLPAAINTAKAELTEDLSNELPNNQTLIDNVVEKVPIVKVAEVPTFVDSVDDMTDTSKMYVLTTDGMFYAYGEKTQNIVTEAKNRFDPSTATISARLSGSSGSVSGTSSLGSFVTDFLPVPNYSSTKPFNVVLNFEGVHTNDNRFVLYNSSKARIGSANIITSQIVYPNCTIADGKTVIDIRKDESGADFNLTDVAYVRIQIFMRNDGSGGNASTALTSEEIANVTIKYQHESSVTTETGAGFYSTGIVYNQPADYENRVIALETTTANNSADINVIKQQIANLESGKVEVTIPEWWEDAVSECVAKIKALQVGRNCITFPFFSDNHQRLGYTGMLISHIMKECNIPYCFYGGDSISSGTIADEATMIEQDKAFDTMMSYVPNGRLCRAVGNHDGYWYDGTNKYWYNRNQVYELFLREESIAQNKHFGDDGTYYYVDDIASKVRWIVLNFNDYDDIQLAWMDTALTFSESGWGVVFVSHAPITSHYHAYNAKDETVRTKLKNYINGTSANKADVIGWFGGHIHRDRIFDGVASNPNYNGSTDPTTDAETGNPIGEVLPWKTVTIISDNVSIGYGGVKHAIDNSDQSHAIDFVTINKDTRTVNLTRLGFGEDRSYTY